MKQLISRLFDFVFPWRAAMRQTIQGLSRELHEQIALSSRYSRELTESKREVEFLTRERDTARKQFQEVRQTNWQNAAAHRATEVAMLRQNHALQAAEARLAGKSIHPELAAAAKEVPAMRIPAFVPVQKPDQIQSP